MDRAVIMDTQEGLLANMNDIGGQTRRCRCRSTKGYRYIKGNARLKLKVDMKTQTIYFSLPMNLENRSKIDLQHIGFLSSRPNGYSASVSYNLDLTHDYAGNHQFSGTSFEGNLTGYMFTPFGSIRNSEQFYYQTFKGISQPNAIRLGTTYEYDQPNVPRSFYAGDIITPSTGWSRGVFMGQVEVIGYACAVSIRP